MVTQLKSHFHLGMALPLKLLIWGVPSHTLVAIVFIRCPMSSSGWVGVGGKSGCPLGSHPLPLRKVTSWSSTSGFLFPTGFSQGVSGGSLGGVFSSLRATSQWRSSMNCHSLASPRSQGSPAIDMGSSHLGGGNWGMVEVPPPIWCWRLGTRRFCIPYHYKGPHMGGRGRRHSKSNRFFT